MKKEATYSLSSHFVLMLVCFSMILIMMTGCNKNGNNSLIIDLDRNDKVSIFDLVDSISVVRLETNKECFIKNIKQIIPYENRLYIFDSRLNAIFCYDENGKYLFKINKKGRGPDEYEYAEFININKYNDHIMILVPWGYLYFYDLNGNFISKIELPKDIIAYNEVYAINKDTLLFISFNQIRVSYYSISEKRILKRFLEVSLNKHYSISPTNKSYIYMDSIYFNDNSDYCKILNLSDTNNPVVFNWNFGKYNNKQSQFRKIYNSQFNKKSKRRKATLTFEQLRDLLNNYPYSSMESNKYRGISLIIKNDHKQILYNKQDNSYLVFNETIEGIKPFSSLSNQVAGLQICNSKTIPYLDKILNEKQKELISSHNPENDNPILLKFHFK